MPERDLLRTMLALERESRTGVLDVAKESSRTFIHVRNGIPVFAEDGGNGETFGKLLLRQNHISQDQYRASIDRMTDAIFDNENMRFAEVVVQLGYLSVEQVQKALSDQVRWKIVKCIQTEDPTVTFDESSDRSEGIGSFPFPVRPLALAASRWLEPARLEKLFAPHADRFPWLVMAPDAIATAFALSSDERLFVATIDGTRPLKTHLAATPRGVDPQAIFASLLMTDTAKMEATPRPKEVAPPTAPPPPVAPVTAPTSPRGVTPATPHVAFGPASPGAAFAPKRSPSSVDPHEAATKTRTPSTVDAKERPSATMSAVKPASAVPGARPPSAMPAAKSPSSTTLPATRARMPSSLDPREVAAKTPPSSANQPAVRARTPSTLDARELSNKTPPPSTVQPAARPRTPSTLDAHEVAGTRARTPSSVDPRELAGGNARDRADAAMKRLFAAKNARPTTAFGKALLPEKPPSEKDTQLLAEQAYKTGKAHIHAGRIDAALAAFRRASDAFSDAKEYQLYAAWAEFQSARDEKVVELRGRLRDLANALAREEPQGGFSRYVLGRLALLEKDDDNAERLLRYAQKLDPSLTDADRYIRILVARR